MTAKFNTDKKWSFKLALKGQKNFGVYAPKEQVNKLSLYYCNNHATLLSKSIFFYSLRHNSDYKHEVQEWTFFIASS